MSTEKPSTKNKKGVKSEQESTDEALSAETPKPTPTGDMLTAHLLAMLNGWSAYGYELAQRLDEAGLGKYNKGSIYRILRQMENSGLVSSSWDTSKDGPARRIYNLTDGGSQFLKNWMVMADMHRKFISSMLEMNPLIPKPSRSKKTDESKNED